MVAVLSTEGSLVVGPLGAPEEKVNPEGKESREVFLGTMAPCQSSDPFSPFPFLLAPLCRPLLCQHLIGLTLSTGVDPVGLLTYLNKGIMFGEAALLCLLI